ncbi:MAG: MurR/RpiR family transcriptional regulator [Solobacterium sp.]|nr:MurR/RpiR family transcriptional regulator [Solobacterium sp.]
MKTLEKIQEMLPDFSKNERRIADHILKYPYDLQRFSSNNIADVCNVSRSAVIRFCQKLGFTGFIDFQKTVLREYETANTDDSAEDLTALDIYQSCIDQLRKTDSTELSVISDLMAHARRILCYGRDHSRYSAQQMAFRLSRNHIDATYTGDDSVLRSNEGILGSGDILAVFSISGAKVLADSLDVFRSKRVSVILFTMNPNTSLNSHADHIFLLPSASHSGSPYLLDDAICFFLAIEMVIENIQKKLRQQK